MSTKLRSVAKLGPAKGEAMIHEAQAHHGRQEVELGAEGGDDEGFERRGTCPTQDSLAKDFM
jgi:hypothetical protein